MNQNIVVKKFGGTSVGSLERINKVAARVCQSYKQGELPVVVVSAMSGETNRLVGLARELGAKAESPAFDMLLASGEQVSLSLLSLALEARGIKNQPLLGLQAGIQTDSHFSGARIEKIKTEKLKTILSQGQIPIIAGFQGVTSSGQITTLGRGGSDLTALALAAALNLDSCEIYTDVEGVFTADPRLVRQARKMQEVDFHEMMEMAYLGSQVLHLRSVELACKYGIKIHVRHAFKDQTGTWIKKRGKMENSKVSAVAHDRDTLIVQINKLPKKENFVSELFNQLGQKKIFIDIVSQGKIMDSLFLSFSVRESEKNKVYEILKKELAETSFSFLDNVAKVSIVGVGMAQHSGVAGSFFSVFSKLKVPLYLVTTSEIKMSAIIDKKYLAQVAEELHKNFGLVGK